MKPEVGMPATYGIGSDCYPMTIIEVRGNTIVIAQECHAVRVDDRGPYTENQHYLYHENKDGEVMKFTLRKNGTWRRANGSGYLVLGERHKYRDPSF